VDHLVEARLMADDITPHFAFPFQKHPTRDTVVVWDQDSDAELDDSVEVLMLTEPGERYDEPGYGMPDFAFTENGVDPSIVSTGIRKWEPRAPGGVDENSFSDLVQRLRIDPRRSPNG
jgi:hypothetical protein